jgi:hypothetical protein
MLKPCTAMLITADVGPLMGVTQLATGASNENAE